MCLEKPISIVKKKKKSPFQCIEAFLQAESSAVLGILRGKQINGVNEFRAHGGRCKRRRSSSKERREAICVDIQA